MILQSFSVYNVALPNKTLFEQVLFVEYHCSHWLDIILVDFRIAVFVSFSKATSFVIASAILLLFSFQ